MPCFVLSSDLIVQVDGHVDQFEVESEELLVNVHHE